MSHGQPPTSGGERGSWRWSWMQRAWLHPVQGRGMAGGLGSGGVGTVATASRALRTLVANGSWRQSHLACSQLPPGGSGDDHPPDGELVGIERMWDLFCIFSVRNLSVWDCKEPNPLQIVVLACILTICWLWIFRLVRKIQLMFLFLSCLARKMIWIGCLGFCYCYCQTKVE